MPDKCSGFTTLTGIPVSELRERLDAELPAAAYSQVPGAADLTDTDPGYMRHVLNTVFGISGFGWGIKYNSEDLVGTAEQRRELARRGDAPAVEPAAGRGPMLLLGVGVRLGPGGQAHRRGRGGRRGRDVRERRGRLRPPLLRQGTR